jgi:hypothetical protein
MASLLHFRRNPPRAMRVSHGVVLVGLLLILCGCKGAFRIEDPQLKPIREMIEKNLPIGTTDGAVQDFLSARGYPTEPPQKPGTMVAVIRHIDTERLQPVTARVTFYFDAYGKLNTYEIVRTANAPIPQ